MAGAARAAAAAGAPPSGAPGVTAEAAAALDAAVAEGAAAGAGGAGGVVLDEMARKLDDLMFQMLGHIEGAAAAGGTRKQVCAATANEREPGGQPSQ